MENRQRNHERKARQKTLTANEDEEDFLSLQRNYKIPKVSAEERECRQMLKDSGFDTKGMTKEEMFEIVQAIRLSKEDAPGRGTKSPYDMDTQIDHNSQAESGYPENNQSGHTSQEFGQSGEREETVAAALSQSDAESIAVENEEEDEEDLFKEQRGRRKSAGRISFRLSPPDVEEELLEDIHAKTDKKESTIKEERSRKLSEAFKDSDSIFGKVVKTCKKAAAFLSPGRKTTESPVIIPDSPEHEVQNNPKQESKVKKTSHKRNIIESSDDEDPDFVPEKPKNTPTFKRMKLMTSTKTREDKMDTECPKDEGPRSLSRAEIELQYFREDLEDKKKCQSFDADNRKAKSWNGRRKTQTCLFAPDIAQVEGYTKVILQAFEIYYRKLYLLQSKSRRFVKMGEPVKPGRHMDNTIDVKRRGDRDKAIASSVDDEDLHAEDDRHSQHSSVHENNVDFMDDGAREMKPEPEKKVTVQRPLRLTKSRRKVNNKVQEAEKETLINNEKEEDDDEMVEVSDKSSQVEDVDVELAEYFVGQDKENHPAVEHRETPEEQFILNRYSPDILMDEDTFLKLEKKPAPKHPGKKEKQLEFNMKALRNKANKKDIIETDLFERNPIKIPSSKTKFRRHPSNISTASSDSTSRMEEDFIQELAKKDRVLKMMRSKPAGNEDILFNPHGDVYATQMCAMEEKHSKEFEGNEEIPNTQMTENYFDMEVEEGKTKEEKKSVDGSKCIEELENSIDFASGKISSVDEVVIDDSDKEVNFNTKCKLKENSPNQQTTSINNQEGEVKLNIKRRYGLGKARKIQNIVPKDGAIDFMSTDFEDQKDIKTELDDDWLSARNWKKEKQTVKTYSKRKKAAADNTSPPPAQVSEKVPCPMCYQTFDAEHIETHAAECQGEIEDADGGNETPEEENIQEPSSPSPVKPVKRSVKLCILCEKPLPRGYEQFAHPHCLEEATQAQHMADKGLQNTQEEFEAPRKTRLRGRSQNSKSATSQNPERSEMFVLDDD